MTTGRLIFNGAGTRITAFDVPDATRLVARFSHRMAEDGFPPARRSTYFHNQGIAQVQIQVARNDYYLNADLPAVRKSLRQYAQYFADVSGIGFSMGGFGCLLLARALQMKRVLLVSPQRRSFPKGRIVGEADYGAERAVFDHRGGRYAGLPPFLHGVVLFDPWSNMGRDRAYARILGEMVPGLHALALPGGGHPATGMIHANGCYGALQQSFLKTRLEPGDFKALHRRCRTKDADYLAVILQRLLNSESGSKVSASVPWDNLPIAV